jgi:uracil-DNA glycosylase
LSELGSFPFGQPVFPLKQRDRSRKDIFVLGVYASAVHARWVSGSGRELAKALAVASEPYIFWRGDNPETIIDQIRLPAEAGHLEPAASMFNGPSGIALDECFLAPLNRTRNEAWLADLVPHSCVNGQQLAALQRCYLPRMTEWGLPVPSVPSVPSALASPARRDEIVAELIESKARILVLLGDEPIRWFSSKFHPQCRRLVEFGADQDTYGRLTEATIDGHHIALLPLAHPRQVARLGRSSARWYDLHREWINRHAPNILS